MHVEKNEQNKEPESIRMQESKERSKALKEFFDQWLRSGDLKKIAEKLDKSYIVVRQTRLSPDKSRKISEAIYAVCLSNKLYMESLNTNLDLPTIDMIMQIDDRDVRLGLWNKLTGRAL